jgi:3-deoxy-alpha-D-manno-octulosonate 8-oxidase
MKFRIFKQVPRIIYGEKSILRFRELLPEKASKGLIIVDTKVLSMIPKPLTEDKDIKLIEFNATKGEPYTWKVDKIVDELANYFPIDFILGIGGGSTMDIAKSVSVCLKNSEKSEKLQGWDLVKAPGVFKIGIPTIFGSGSEASRTAVLNNGTKKQGINSDYSMFDAIILDPSVSSGIDKNTKFYTAMDCYIHCVESVSGTMINQLSEGYATKALSYCDEYFSNEMKQEELICVGSYYGGVSIVNSEVGICHALSYGLSIEFGLRHGLANCVVFKVLEDYYGEYVSKFNSLLNDYEIILPKNICSNIEKDKMKRMIDQTLMMERPLLNALGSEWRDILTREKIEELYLRM